ncbi:MAG TPA: DUF924 family protein [Pseudomonadales bacterium]|nr:DUF924 family protein [Pseudomonadales bacterium]
MQETILSFWFEELSPQQWFTKSDATDQKIAARFSSIHHAASQGECYQWRDQALGRLAEIIVLDQFSRNIYRDHPSAFASDAMALALAQEAVWLGVDQDVSVQQRAFFYMPYMHSESPLIHQQAMQLFNQPGMENNLAFEIRHKEIIDRFGRYPHRNAILGRISSQQEEAFLSQPNASF